MRPRPHGPAWPDMRAAERLARGGLAPQTVTVNPPAHFDVGCHGPWEEDPARELAVEAEKVRLEKVRLAAPGSVKTDMPEKPSAAD